MPLTWLSDYLSNRSQKTRINGICSDTKQILAGCPQGSVLSILFNLFINNIFQLVIPNIKIFLYADDTAIIITADNKVELQLLTNEFFKKYPSWCLNNCIVVNPMKSNYLKFNTFVITVEFNGHVLENPA